MIDWLALDPVVSTTIFLPVIVVLFILFLLLEMRRPKKFLWFRIVALVFMMLALTAIALRPSKKTIQSTSVALLTSNFSQSKIDSIVERESVQLVAMPGLAAPKNALSLKSINELQSISGKVDFIAGEGLPDRFHNLLEGHDYEYIPAPYPNGFINIEFPDQTFANREVELRGSFKGAGSTKLVLEVAGQKQDSVNLAPGIQSFKLNFTPKETGNFLYNLIAENENGERNVETLPISVQPHRSLRILFIQNFPTFETQYLKKFLGKRNAVQIRYQLSKSTFRHESINMENRRINKLNIDNLEAFDLLIIDSDALESLNSSELSDLHTSVKNGLGLAVLFNQSPGNLRMTKSFIPVEFKKFDTDTARLNLKKQIVLPAWPISPGEPSQLRPIIRNKNRILSGYMHNGFGKTAFQLLQETYHLVLNGDSTSYSKIWSDIIEVTARKEKSDFYISIKNKFPIYQDEPIDIQIVSAGEIPSLTHDSTSISIEEDLIIDNIWKTTIWADRPGWHFIGTKQNSEKKYFYVSGKDEWKSLSAANSIRETILRSAAIRKESGQLEILQPIDPKWFYLVFIFSAGALWLFPKL